MTDLATRDQLGIAYCPHERCQCDTLPHTASGTCLFCDSVILDRYGRPLYSPNGRIVYPKKARASKHTQESILEQIQTYARKHGHAPSHRADYGLTSAARRVFGTWGAAITAAGVEPARIGRPKQRSETVSSRRAA